MNVLEYRFSTYIYVFLSERGVSYIYYNTLKHGVKNIYMVYTVRTTLVQYVAI